MSLNGNTSIKLVIPHFDDPDSKVHKANMGPTWDRQDPGGPHVVSMNLAIWGRLRNANVALVQDWQLPWARNERVWRHAPQIRQKYTFSYRVNIWNQFFSILRQNVIRNVTYTIASKISISIRSMASYLPVFLVG